MSCVSLGNSMSGRGGGQRDPAAALAGRALHRLDELDAAQAVVDRREVAGLVRLASALAGGTQVLRDLGVDRGEGLEVALGMAAGDAGHAGPGGSELGSGTLQDLGRLAQWRVAQLVGQL